MRKRIISLFLIMCAFVGVFSLSSCQKSYGSIDNINDSKNNKYVVDLSINNFYKYFDCKVETIYSQYQFNITGCLDYAFYKDVKIIVYSESKKEETIYDANYAGNCVIIGDTSTAIIRVSGTVIFWM